MLPAWALLLKLLDAVEESISWEGHETGNCCRRESLRCSRALELARPSCCPAKHTSSRLFSAQEGNTVCN
jgi:hypothetical protein